MGEKGYTTQVYRDEAGEWRWRRTAANNRIVAVSGEGYVNRLHALEQALEFFPDDDFDLTLSEGVEEMREDGQLVGFYYDGKDVTTPA